MALVTTYRVGETLLIGDTVEVKVVAVHAGRVTLSVEAPKGVVVYRQRQQPLAEPKADKRGGEQP